jgi:hypothetical protein
VGIAYALGFRSHAIHALTNFQLRLHMPLARRNANTKLLGYPILILTVLWNRGSWVDKRIGAWRRNGLCPRKRLGELYQQRGWLQRSDLRAHIERHLCNPERRESLF